MFIPQYKLNKILNTDKTLTDARETICRRPEAIWFILQHPEKINWWGLVSNTHPIAIQMLEGRTVRQFNGK